MLISVKEAHDRFGDLAHIRNGVTTWITVAVPGGWWKPVLNSGFILTGYRFEGDDTGIVGTQATMFIVDDLDFSASK